MILWALALLALPAAAAAPDARAIVEQSIRNDAQNYRVTSAYSYQAREITREFEGGGTVRKTTTKLTDFVYLGGRLVNHLIERDGKPLPPADARKETEKLDRAVAEANRLTPAERAKRERDYTAQRLKERDRLQPIPQAYDLKLLGETELRGRAVWIIEATPTGHYHGKYAALLRNTRGRLFIDQKDYQWVRVEAEVLDNIRFGLFLATVSKGTHLTFEQTRVNDEVWLPLHFDVTAAVRLLVKRERMETSVEFSNYRKFSSDSRITGVSEAP